MKKIALIGAPGVGKTTIANGLMYTLKTMGKHVELVPELIKYKVYQNLDFNAPNFDIDNTNEQKGFEEIFNSDGAKGKIDYLICEGPLCNGYFYSNFYNKINETVLLKEVALSHINNYDLIIFVENDKEMEYVSFGRKESQEQSMQFEDMIKNIFQELKFSNELIYVNKNTDMKEIIKKCL